MPAARARAREEAPRDQRLQGHLKEVGHAQRHVQRDLPALGYGPVDGVVGHVEPGGDRCPRPDLDPQGVCYHINQARLAIGSGGWFGLGLGKSRQKFQYLPEVAGDSIFAIISEELGFIVSALVILAYLAFVRYGLRVAERASDPFARYAAIGITAWIGFQAVLNISAMVGLMPLTGVPLPLISHGGSAMLANLMAVGVLASISREGKVARVH